MIKLLVFSALFFGFIRAETDEELIEKWLAETFEENQVNGTSNETDLENCNDELNNAEVCLNSVGGKYSDILLNTDRFDDKDYMLALIEKFKNTSCFHDTNCTNVKLVEYIHLTFLEVGDIIYGPGYNCLSKERNAILKKFDKCHQEWLVSENQEEINTESYIKRISLCVAAKLDCPDNEISVLLTAADLYFNLANAFFHPANLLAAVGASEQDLSSEELASIILFFKQWDL
uniref:DUF19 domain-containing protein n=1 Tax=Caenorhabditis tropicalis TaxID=1561998 RepID=A0A1I7URL5_9PELO